MRFLTVAGAALAAALLMLAAVIVLAMRHGVAAVPFGSALAVGAVNLLLTPDDAGVPEDATSGDLPKPGSDLPEIRGVASGDLTWTSAVVWVGTSGAGEVVVDVREEGALTTEPLFSVYATTVADLDHAVAVRLDGLEPDTPYVYEAHAQRLIDARLVTALPQSGRFRTAPDPLTRRDISFVFSGDLGGGGYCRHADSGYAVFDAMRGPRPDFFVAMGDMIYADNTCPAANPRGESNIPGGFPSVASRAVDWTRYDQMRAIYFQHWRYNRADDRFQAFLRATPMYVLWDDHEIVNDSGAAWEYHHVTDASRDGFPILVAAARDALFAYNPIARDPAAPKLLYRRVRWGADLDLFLLDTRSYRSRNDLADTPENQKTMLGREQLQWLKNEVRLSPATWKVVATSVPLSIPTGGMMAPLYGRDAWANGTSWDYSSQTGFERELLDLLRSLDEVRVQNVVFLAGDAHQAAEIRYTTDPDGDGRPLVFHEVVAGPLSAPPFRTEPQLDPTLNPTMLYRESGLFNFGYVRIERGPDGLAHFIAEIRGVDGQPRPGSRLDLTPAQ